MICMVSHRLASDEHVILKINTYIKCGDCTCDCSCIVLAIIL